MLNLLRLLRPVVNQLNEKQSIKSSVLLTREWMVSRLTTSMESVTSLQVTSNQLASFRLGHVSS